MAKKLEQTRGSFKVKGLVKGMDRDNAFEEEERVGGAHSGETYRKLNLGLQTAPDNQLRLGIFSYEPEQVFLWNNDKKKKDKSYKGERMDFDEYLEKKEILRENGTAILQARVGVEYDEKGKLQSEGMTSFEATELIYDNVDNDDGAYVEGQVSYSSYENQQGETKTGVNYNIDRFFKAKEPFDLEDEDYEAQNYYEQQFVYVDSFADKTNHKLTVLGRVIDYRENTVDAEFVINYGEDESMKKLATNVKKKFKFGDLVTVFGEIFNKSVEEEVEDAEDTDMLSSLGGKSQPKYAQGYTNTTYIREMTIDGVLDWQKKVYTEEDFEASELVEEDEDDLSSELGGKSKKKMKNDFDEDLDEDEDPFGADDDEDSDDLPF